MIRLTPEAEGDLERAVQWYDGQRPGLGNVFLLDLRQTFDRIELFPEGYPAVRPNVRRTLLTRFPYAVTYTSLDDGLLVLAVLHQKQARKRALTAR